MPPLHLLIKFLNKIEVGCMLRNVIIHVIPRGSHSNGKRGYQARPWTHKKHPNHVFFRYEIDPKYAFLHAFFLIWLSCPFQNFSIWPKTHFFSPILHVFAPLNDVRAYIAWSWKTTLITWIFGRAWYPLWHSSTPLGVIRSIDSISRVWKMLYYHFKR